MAVLGIWLWSRVLTFGLGSRHPKELGENNECAGTNAVIVILGRGVPFQAPRLRILSLILYALLLFPGANLVAPMCMFLALYIWWIPLVHRFSQVQQLGQDFIQRYHRERQADPWWLDYHGFWCQQKIRAQLWIAHVAASLTPVRLEAVPAYAGLMILLLINLIFVIDIELTLRRNYRIQDQEQDEAEWGFGQILAILLLVLPLRDLIEALLARRSKQRQREVDEDLQEAIRKKDLDSISRAIERGASFPMIGLEGNGSISLLIPNALAQRSTPARSGSERVGVLRRLCDFIRDLYLSAGLMSIPKKSAISDHIYGHKLNISEALRNRLGCHSAE
jgi:hypothetical protein